MSLQNHMRRLKNYNKPKLFPEMEKLLPESVQQQIKEPY